MSSLRTWGSMLRGRRRRLGRGWGRGGVPGGAGRRITYGATEIVPPADFLKSLASLAR